MGKSLNKPVAVRLDDKGRLSIPLAMRKKLGVSPGDTFFIQTDGEGLRIVKGSNPFDGLVDQAILEYQSSSTRNLRDIVGEWKDDE